MKQILYILLLFLSSWGYSQQEVELCGEPKTYSYWASSTGNGITEWTLVGNSISETHIGNEISLTWSDSGTYVLHAIRYDGPCPSNEVILNVTVTQCGDLIFWVPNTFTPDNDASNEEWGPVFTSGYDPNSFNMTVLNRWGNTIWESNNVNATWDGTFKNKQCQEGVYTWIMTFNLSDSNKKYKSHGHITLIR